MCRGAQISLTQIVATSRCRLLPRVVCFGAAIWFAAAAADAFKFNSQRKCLRQKKEKVCKPDWPRGQRVAHSLLGTDLAHSSFQVCRCRSVVYVMPVISELACGAQSAQCISLKRFYEPQGCRMEALPPHLHLALLWPVPAPILMDPFGPIRHGN